MAEPWGVCVRISKAKDGSTLGVERQEPPARALVERLGGEVVEVYVRNDVSGFNATRFPFEDALADLHAGRIRGLAAWQADRFTRRVGHALTLLDAVEQTRGKLATVGGEYDLSTAAGRFNFRQMANMAEFESDLRGERVRLKLAQNAAAGKHHGGPRPFGYEQDRVTVREGEAALIREAARRILAGEGTVTVCKDWNQRGVRMPRGSYWDPTSLRRILLGPRIAGLRQHHGQVVGEAKWPAVIDRPTWEQLRSVLSDPKRQKGGRPTSYLLAGLLLCGQCEHHPRLYGRQHQGRALYTCQRPARGGCDLGVLAELIEGEVTARLLRRLAGPKLLELRARARSGDPEAQRLEAERKAAEVDLEQLGRDYGAGLVRREAFFAAQRVLEARIETAVRALDRRPKLAALADLPDTSAELEAAWERWSLAKKRSVLKAVLKTVVVKPVGKGSGGRFDPTRVECRWLV